MCSVEQTQASSAGCGIQIVSSVCRPASRNQTTQCKWNSMHAYYLLAAKLQQWDVHDHVNISLMGLGWGFAISFQVAPRQPVPCNQSACLFSAHSIKYYHMITTLSTFNSYNLLRVHLSLGSSYCWCQWEHKLHSLEEEMRPSCLQLWERSRGACSRASRCRRRHATVAKVVSREERLIRLRKECFIALFS